MILEFGLLHNRPVGRNYWVLVFLGFSDGVMMEKLFCMGCVGLFKVSAFSTEYLIGNAYLSDLSRCSRV